MNFYRYNDKLAPKSSMFSAKRGNLEILINKGSCLASITVYSEHIFYTWPCELFPCPIVERMKEDLEKCMAQCPLIDVSKSYDEEGAIHIKADCLDVLFKKIKEKLKEYNEKFSKDKIWPLQDTELFINEEFILIDEQMQ